MGRLFDEVVRIGSAILRRLLLGYFDVRVSGLENLPSRGPAIVAGNHPSLIDGLLLYLVSPAPLRFIVHRELFRHPLIGWLMRGLGFINAELRRDALREAEEALGRGEIVVIFPEGGAYERGRMEEIHLGVAWLAVRTGAPVIPLGIAGSDEAFPLGSYLPRPGRIAMVLGPGTTWGMEGASADDAVAALIDLRARIMEVVADAAPTLSFPARRGLLRSLEVGACAVLFLPLVAMLTFLAHDLEKPSC
jgi:1-acyl-sn-glycerol-3-phosphate acyltransferase